MSFVKFAAQATAVNMGGACGIFGVVNGYKINEVLHHGERVDVRGSEYYYIPRVNRVVSYRGSKAHEMTPSKQYKYNFRKVIGNGFAKTYHVDCASVLHAGSEIYI